MAHILCTRKQRDFSIRDGMLDTASSEPLSKWLTDEDVALLVRMAVQGGGARRGRTAVLSALGGRSANTSTGVSNLHYPGPAAKSVSG